MPQTATISQEERKARDRCMEEEWEKTQKIFYDLGISSDVFDEHLIAPNLIEKFNDIGFDFRTASSNRKFYDIKQSGDCGG